MARALPTLLVLALLGATSAAFAVTEGRKLEKTPIARTQVGVPSPAHPQILGPALFSPVCVCASDHVELRFSLRKPDRVTVTIRRDGRVVDTVVEDREYAAGRVTLEWDGVMPSGLVAADGVYKPYVHLAREHRTIGLPNPIRVDTTPPPVIGVEAKPRLLSPDGDGRGDALHVRWKLADPGHGLLFVDGKRRVRTRLARTSGSLRWYGVDGGEPLAKGAHRLAFAAEDPAGNVSKLQRLGQVTIRYVSLGRKLISIGPGERFYLRVSSDAKRLHWLFAGRRGLVKPGTIVLRAPRREGTFRLFLWYGSHGAQAKVKVERIG